MLSRARKRALVEDAAAHDSRIAWRLDSLRQTVSLLGQLSDVPLPRSFVLTESMLAESVPPADDRRATPIFQPAREPSLWARWKRFWQSGNPTLRNAATVCAVLLVIVLVGDLSTTQNRSSSDASLRNNLVTTQDMTQDSPAQAEVALLNSQTARPAAKTEIAAAPISSAADLSESDQAEISIAPSALRQSAMPSALEAPITEDTLAEADLGEVALTESDTVESSSSESSSSESSSSESPPVLTESVAEEPQTVEADEPMVGAAMMAVDAASLADEASTVESESSEGTGEAGANETRDESVSDDADTVAVDTVAMDTVAIDSESSATARIQSESPDSAGAVEVESPLMAASNMSIESETASEDVDETTINAAAPPTSSPAPVALAQEQSETSVEAGDVASSNNSQPSVPLEAQQQAVDQAWINQSARQRSSRGFHGC